MAGALVRALLDLWLGDHCPGCAAPLPPGRRVCSACEDTSIHVATVAHCPRCSDLEGPALCRRCSGEGPPFETVEAGLVWGPAVRDAVHRLKFENAPWVARPLWHWAFPEVPAALQAAEVLVPMPLHAQRHRERGYNQAQLLAESAAEHVGSVPVVRALRRIRRTAPVATIRAASRPDAVKDAFGVALSEVVKGRRVVLVDDVVTTSATARAAAVVLVAAGAASVAVVCVARGGELPDDGAAGVA